MSSPTRTSGNDRITCRHSAAIGATSHSAAIGLCVLDRDFRFVRINNRLADIDGLPAADHIGKPFSEVLPDLASAVEPVLQQILETGEPVVDHSVRVRVPPSSHTGQDWLASFIPLWSEETVTAVSVLVRDVTAHREAEQDLRHENTTLEEQVRLRTAMIEMLHDIASHVHEAASLEEAVLFVLRRVGEYNGWCFGQAFLVPSGNDDRLIPLQAHYQRADGTFDEFCRLSGTMPPRRGAGLAGRAVALGEPVWAKSLPGDLRAERVGILEQLPIAAAAAFPVTVNSRVDLVLEFFSTHPIEDDVRIRQGMQNVGIHLARTIERLRADAALRESEQRFRELAERTSQVFWVLDPASDRLLYVSPEWSRIVGRPPPTVSDADQWRSYVHPDDRQWVDDEFDTNASAGDFDVVYRVVRSDGDIRWIHDVAVPVHDDMGNIRRIIGVAEDVTERRELEREVANAATYEQQRLSRDLHDSIGQELTGLTMMAAKVASQLRRTSPDGGETISGLVDGLKRTLQQVRRISRGLAPVDIKAGGLTVALAQLAEQTRLIATTECIFRCETPAALRDPGTASHLYRIAQEAVSNAVKHAQAKTITITLRAAEGFCELTVEDDGCGLAQRQRPAVDGMGLKIMRYRANLIGAQFRIEGTKDGGARIVCRVRQDGQSPATPESG